jgi:hypothetical protein
VNSQQQLWWSQAMSDLTVLELLRKNGAGECHQLHYMQMVSEKIAKAYYWRNGKPPARNHSGFVRFLQSLLNRDGKSLPGIIKLLGYDKVDEFRWFIRRISPLAYELQSYAPALANDGPNPEYPWPHVSPLDAPCNYKFRLCDDLQTAVGRNFSHLLDRAVRNFPEYA